MFMGSTYTCDTNYISSNSLVKLNRIVTYSQTFPGNAMCACQLIQFLVCEMFSDDNQYNVPTVN